MENNSEFIHNNQYSLSIRFSSDGFSLYIYDETNLLISKKNIEVSLQSLKEDIIFETITREVETQFEFKNTRVICESNIYTLIPNAFFSHETVSDYLYFERETGKNECIIIDQLPAWDNTLISALPQNLHNAIKRIYPTAKIQHHLASFLSDVIKDRNDNSMKIWARTKMLDVAVISNGNITLLNSYPYNTPEDFTFFVLNIFEQLSLDTETFKVHIYNSAKNIEIKNILQKYLKELTVVG